MINVLDCYLRQIYRQTAMKETTRRQLAHADAVAKTNSLV